MANEMTYMKSAIPQEVGRRTKVKTEWLGLNESNTLNTGELCAEKNISADAYPYLMPCEKPVVWGPKRDGDAEQKNIHYESPYYMEGFGDTLFVIHKLNNNMVFDLIKKDVVFRLDVDEIYGGGQNGYYWERLLRYPMPILEFNQITNSNNDYLTGEWNRYFMVLPIWMRLPRNVHYSFDSRPGYVTGSKNDVYCEIIGYGTENETWKYYTVEKDTFKECAHYPIADPLSGGGVNKRDTYGTTHLGRIFATGGSVVTATDYGSWSRTFDTGTNYNESHAWGATFSGNTKAGGETTGIYSYAGRVVVFEKDFMHEIYNTKNPFRVVDVCAVGCIDHRSIQEVDSLLYFCSEEGVYVYNGESMPRLISHNLNIQKIYSAVGGVYDHKYYLWGIEKETWKRFFYVYDTETGLWTKQQPFNSDVCKFGKTDFGFFALCNDGHIYRIDSGVYEGQEWSAETDLSTEGTVDTKRLRKVQMYADFTKGSSLKVTLITDSGEKEVFHYTADGDKKVPIRFSIRKSSSVGMKLRFDGVGKVKLYHMELEMTEGGERFVTG